MAVAGLQNLSCYSLSKVGEFSCGTAVSSSHRDDDTLKTPGSCHSQRRLKLIGDDVRSSRSGINGSTSDGVRYASEDIDGAEIQCAGVLDVEHEDNLSCLSEQLSDVGETGRHRVRQVFREWMKNGGFIDSSDGFRRTSSLWNGKNQAERVKDVKEWVQTNNQKRSERESVAYRDAGACLQIDQVRNGKITQRPIRRICGRQTLADLLQRAQQERKGDLMALQDRKPVSCFAHRNRIQAFLRGRFLRNETVIPEKKPSSVAALELNMLTQRRTVSGLREEFLLKSPSGLTFNSEQNSLSGDENISELESPCKEIVADNNQIGSDGRRNHTESTMEVAEANQLVSWNPVERKQNPSRDHEPVDVEDRELNTSNSVLRESENASCNELQENIYVADHPIDMEEIVNKQCDSSDSSSVLNERSSTGSSEEVTNQWLFEASDVGTQMLELGGDWPRQDFQSIESWMSMPSPENGESSRTSSSIHCQVEDIDRYTELRELFCRKRVSTLVQGSFGEHLNWILRARLQKRRLVSGDLESDNSSPSLTAVEHSRREENEDQASALLDAYIPSPHCFQDWVAINDMRIEMARLEEKMDDIQNMLEDCLGMQSELQRSIQQEFSAAASVLNHSVTSIDESIQDTKEEESYWDFLRRGICCICHTCHIDSVIYRCGHICTCSRCAEELVRCTGKCPICSFSVLDTFRVSSTTGEN